MRDSNFSYKNYKIFRFDVFAKKSKSKNHNKLLKLRWDYAGAHVEFKTNLIDTFCSLNFEAILKKYSIYNQTMTGIQREKYKKSWIISEYDIGFDMLEEEYGLRQENHWHYIYYLVPINQIEILKFFEKQKFPFNVKIISKI